MSTTSPVRRGLGSRGLLVGCILGGLLLGLTLALLVARGAEAEYSAASNFAVLPGTKSTGSDLGQVGFLTPVFAAQANDPGTKDEVTARLGGKEPAAVVSQTYPDSNLLFTVTATGTDPELVYTTLQAYEEVLTQRAEAGKPVTSVVARLQVIAHAVKPTESESLNPKVILMAGSLAGAAVGLALGLGLLRRREGGLHNPGHQHSTSA